MGADSPKKRPAAAANAPPTSLTPNTLALFARTLRLLTPRAIACRVLNGCASNSGGRAEGGVPIGTPCRVGSVGVEVAHTVS